MQYSDLEQKLDYFSEEEILLLRQAYALAFKAHRGQHRKSGEAYISHPISVAIILADMKMDVETVIAGLLHDVVEDSDCTIEEIEAIFGPSVASMVDGVSKLDKIEFKSKLELQAENFRKMLLAMARDIRIIVIKLADRLHNMRTMNSMPKESRRNKALETIDIYAPICRRLGIKQLNNELEELSLKFLHPWRYTVLSHYLNFVKQKHTTWLHDIRLHIVDKFKNNSINLIWVDIREKHVYSVYKKMREKKCSFNEVTDVYGMRICVGTTDDCYRALGVLHLTYRPFPYRFKDYIAAPKPNGYQSLHTVLMGPGGLPVEIQIRTPLMNQMAEHGIAAHWIYKMHGDSTDIKEQFWLKNLLDIQNDVVNPRQFIENVKNDLDAKSVYVFTIDGDIIEMKKGATVLDFAMELSVNLGMYATAARVDHILSPLDTVLKSGQTVVIIKNDDLQCRYDWLNFVMTNKAKNIITNYLNEKKAKDYIKLGEKIFFQIVGRSLFETDFIADLSWQKLILDHYNCRHINEFWISIAKGDINIKELIQVLSGSCHFYINVASLPIVINGDEGDALVYSSCCKPIPGDQIIGFFEIDKGLIVHRNTCFFIKHRNEQDGLILSWSVSLSKTYTTDIILKIINQRGSLGLIAVTISGVDANIENINIVYQNDDHADLLVTIGVNSFEQYNSVLKALKQLRSVISVRRFGSDESL